MICLCLFYHWPLRGQWKKKNLLEFLPCLFYLCNMLQKAFLGVTQYIKQYNWKESKEITNICISILELPELLETHISYGKERWTSSITICFTFHVKTEAQKLKNLRNMLRGISNQIQTWICPTPKPELSTQDPFICLMYGLWTRSTRFSWGLARNAESLISPQTRGIQLYSLVRPPYDWNIWIIFSK